MYTIPEDVGGVRRTGYGGLPLTSLIVRRNTPLLVLGGALRLR